MKKLFGPVLIGIGAFMMVAGLGAKFYAYDRLAVMPANAQIDAVAATEPDQPATYFDIGQLKEVTGPLTNRTKVRGDVVAGQSATAAVGDTVDGDVVVWTSYACTGPSEENCLEDPMPLSGALETTAYAAHGSQVVDWDGNFQETGGERNDDPPTSGYVFKLPFNTEKHDYTWYNADLGKPYELKYDGVTSVQGLRTYRFVQDVAPTKVGTIDIPGSLIGSGEPLVTADIVTSGHLEMDVEPETGVAMTTISSPDKWVEVDGKKVLTMISGTFSLTDETVTDNVDAYKPLALGLKILRFWAPLLGVIGGLFAIVAGFLLTVQSHRRKQPISTAVPADTPLRLSWLKGRTSEARTCEDRQAHLRGGLRANG